jgi:hypothetical protein
VLPPAPVKKAVLRGILAECPVDFALVIPGAAA